MTVMKFRTSSSSLYTIYLTVKTINTFKSCLIFVTDEIHNKITFTYIWHILCIGQIHFHMQINICVMITFYKHIVFNYCLQWPMAFKNSSSCILSSLFWSTSRKNSYTRGKYKNIRRDNAYCIKKSNRVRIIVWI